MARQSPWTLLPAADYERHMGPEGLGQLAPLSAILGRACADLRPRRLLALGVATGNGLDHVDPAVTERVVGVDLNIQYLAVARQRLARLGHRLELYCADLEAVELAPASFDLVWAALVLEWVDLAAALPRIAGWLAPGGSLVAVLQVPAAGGAPGAAGAAGAEGLRAVEASARIVSPGELDRGLAAAGLIPRQRYLVPVRGGRELFAGRWSRPRRGAMTHAPALK
jgi:hypothetical protein